MIRMHRRWLRLLPLFLAAFWLPLQAAAAMAMPFCRHGEAHKMAAMEQTATGHCQMHERHGDADGHAPACDNCEFCHLAAAGFMPTPEYVAAVIASARGFRAEAPLAPASAVPEPPRQPPKRLA